MPDESTAATPRGPRIGVLLGLFYALYLPLAAGFFLHTSPPSDGGRVFGKYSPSYAAFLGLLLAAGAGLPFLARALARPTRIATPDGRALVIAGRRKVGFAAVAALLGALLATVLVEVAWGPPDRPADKEDYRVPCEPVFERWPRRGALGNRHGWRGPDVERRKPPGTFRLFALGGSTTWLTNVRPPSDTFVARLDRSLSEARPDWRFEVENAAFDQNTSLHSLIKYLTVVQDYDPDVVLVMHAINDWAQRGSDVPFPWEAGAYERDYGHMKTALRRIAVAGGLQRPQAPLWARSIVCARLTGFIDAAFASDLRRRQGSFEERSQLAEAWVTQALPAFRRNLRTLGELVQARGGRLVIASQPTMFRPGATPPPPSPELQPEDRSAWLWRDQPERLLWSTTRDLRRYNDAARDVAHELGAAFVDLEAAVPPNWDDFHDSVHLNAAGCAKAADALLERILPLVPGLPATGEEEPRLNAEAR
jgi:lysophospholipase L1-like esterase